MSVWIGTMVLAFLVFSVMAGGVIYFHSKNKGVSGILSLP